MPLSIFDLKVKFVWDKTIEVIKNVDKTRRTNFPDMKENSVAQVRPHRRESKDVFELSVVDKMTGSYVYIKHFFG